MGLEDWLEGVRTGLSAYAEVFRSDGAADEEALALYSMEDEEELEKLLAAAGCPRLNRRLLIDALRALRKARARACSMGAATPGAASSSASSASSGMSSLGIMPTPLVDSDGEEWLPLGDLPDKVMKKRRKVQKVSSCSYAQEVQFHESRAAGTHKLPVMNAIERAFSRASQASWGSAAHGTASLGSVPVKETSGRSSSFPTCTEQGPGDVGVEEEAFTKVTCPRCDMALYHVKERADVEAKRSQAELAKMRGSHHGAYNYSKLRRLLASECFDSHGNYAMHGSCVQAVFKLSSNFMARLHYSVIQEKSIKTEEKEVEVVLRSKDLINRVVLPEDCLLSKHVYLKSREESELVTITTRPGMHGLAGRPSNNTSWRARKLFIDFVKANRSLTGRTELADGRTHGAKYYLSPQFTSIKAPASRKNQHAQQREAQAASAAVAADDGEDLAKLSCQHSGVLADVFRAAMKSYSPDTATVCDTTVQSWFNACFCKADAMEGHTSLFPRKTDACSTCAEFDMEVRKLNASIARHMQHVEDAGSILRQTALGELRAQLQDVIDKRDAHKQEAVAETAYYKKHLSACAREYWRVCSYYNRLVKGDEAISVHQLVEALGSFAFELASDYQQDKSYPHWGLSPQPGETYFMSKITVYVHIILTPACATGVQQRNHLYLRDQQIAGSKDCNDTIFTVFDCLAARSTPQCVQPSLFRTGYQTTAVHPTAMAFREAERTATGVFEAGSASDAAEEAYVDTLINSLVPDEDPDPPTESFLIDADVRRLAQQPQPFIRRLRWQLDAAGGTNKNNFVKHGVGLAVMSGCADVVDMDYMVVGHTKFGPDEVAQKTAGAYHAADVWNQRHMQQLFEPYAHCQSYDKALLCDLHLQLLGDMFSRIPDIRSYRHFRFVADDGHLGADLPIPKLAVDALGRDAAGYPGCTKSAHYYHNDDLEKACHKAVMRSVRPLLHKLLAQDSNPPIYGIGSGKQLLPPSVETIRPVRLFLRPSCTDEYWVEVLQFSKVGRLPEDVAKVNQVLKSLVQTSSSIPSKRYDGQKVTQIQKMFKFMVPECYVPDEYELASRMDSTENCPRQSLQQMLLPFPSLQAAVAKHVADVAANGTQIPAELASEAANGSSDRAQAADPGNRAAADAATKRWSAARDIPILMELCAGKFKLPYANRRAIAERMGFKVTQITNALNKLDKQQQQQQLVALHAPPVAVAQPPPAAPSPLVAEPLPAVTVAVTPAPVAPSPVALSPDAVTLTLPVAPLLPVEPIIIAPPPAVEPKPVEPEPEPVIEPEPVEPEPVEPEPVHEPEPVEPEPRERVEPDPEPIIEPEPAVEHPEPVEPEPREEVEPEPEPIIEPEPVEPEPCAHEPAEQASVEPERIAKSSPIEPAAPQAAAPATAPVQQPEQPRKKRKSVSSVFQPAQPRKAILNSLKRVAVPSESLGDCFPISMMAGFELPLAQLQAPGRDARKLIAKLRSGAVDLIAGTSEVQGISTEAIRRAEGLPVTSVSAEKAMRPWRSCKHWFSRHRELSGAFTLGACLHLGRTCVILERVGGDHFVNPARGYGLKDADSRYKLTTERPHDPPTIPFYFTIPLDELVRMDLSETSVVEFCADQSHFQPLLPSALVNMGSCVPLCKVTAGCTKQRGHWGECQLCSLDYR